MEKMSICIHGVDIPISVVVDDRKLYSSIDVMFNVGGNDDKIPGISHFLEHMMFGDDEYRTKEEKDILTAKLGIQKNAYTGGRYTGYTMSVVNENIIYAVDVLIKSIVSPQFTDKCIDRERGIIIRELKMCESDPDSISYDIWKSNFYPSLNIGIDNRGNSIIGNEESINGITSEDLFNHYNKFYNIHNMCVYLVVPNIDTLNVILHTLTYYLKRWYTVTNVGVAKNPELTKMELAGIPDNQTTKIKNVQNDKFDIAHVYMTYLWSTNNEDEGRYSGILLKVLFESFTGKIKKRIREELSLAYGCTYISEVFDKHRDVISFYINTAKEDTKLVIDEIHNIIDNLTITEEEFAIAKTGITAGYVRMETNYQLISYMQNLDDANLEYSTIDEAVKKFNNMKYDDFIEYVNKNVKGIKPKFIFTFNGV